MFTAMILGSLSILFPASQLLGLADTGNDILHMVDGDGLRTIGFQFFEQFGDAFLDIVGDFLPTLLSSERGM